MVEQPYKPRYTNTFARSNVLGNAEDAVNPNDGKIHNAQTVTRYDKNW